MASSRELRQRWMQLARSAARVQSIVLLALLYILMWIPLGLVRRLFADPLQRGGPPKWRERAPVSHDVVSARRQF